MACLYDSLILINMVSC